MKEVVKNNKINFIIVNICLLLIVFISFFVVVYDDLIVDKVVYNFLINNFSNSYMDSFMISITKLGNTKFVMLFTIIMFVLLWFKNKKKSLSLVFISSVAGVSFINQLLKVIVKRVRPDVNRLIEIGGYSFPSGHAMVSMVLYGLVAYIIYKMVKIKSLRNILISINLLVILLIGISRIYLGVHYFSDIVVGFLISIIFLIVVICFLEKKFFSQN